MKRKKKWAKMCSGTRNEKLPFRTLVSQGFVFFIIVRGAGRKERNGLLVDAAPSLAMGTAAATVMMPRGRQACRSARPRSAGGTDWIVPQPTLQLAKRGLGSCGLAGGKGSELGQDGVSPEFPHVSKRKCAVCRLSAVKSGKAWVQLCLL